MHSLLNTPFISWENILNAELREKVNGNNIKFYDNISSGIAGNISCLLTIFKHGAGSVFLGLAVMPHTAFKVL
jgi:hypothetical protein